MRRSRIGIGKPSVKDRRVIILGSVGYMASVTTTELCHYSWKKKKKSQDHMQTNGCSCVPIKLYLQVISWIYPIGT